MSYDITLYNKPNLSTEGVSSLSAYYETNGSLPKENQIPKKTQENVIKMLQDKGLVFKIFRSEEKGDHAELSFSTYKLSFSKNTATLSIPYWGTNTEEKVHSEVGMVLSVFGKQGFSAYDPQVGHILSQPYTVQKSFRKIQTDVANMDFSPTKNRTGRGPLVLGLIIGIIMIIIIVEELLK